MLSNGRRTPLFLTIAFAAIATASVAVAGTMGVRSDEVYAVKVAGVAGIPEDVRAVALQVTVSDPDAAGYLTVYACGTNRPTASNVNFESGETRSNLVLVGVGAGGRVCIYSRATADLIVDVVGVFDRSTPWMAEAPERVLDTRQKSGPMGQVSAGQVIRVPIGLDATFASLNVTATDSVSGGYLTVFPCGMPIPQTSTVSFAANRATSNLALAPVINGSTCIYTSTSTHIIVDVTGRTSDSSGFSGRVPQRLVDTRTALGGTRLAPGSVLRVRTEPQSVALLNVTTAESTAGGYLTVYSCEEPQPGTSNINFAPGAPLSAAVLVEPSPQGEVCIYSAASTEIIVDIFGSLTRASGYRAVPPIRIIDTRIGMVRRDPTSSSTVSTTILPTTSTPSTTTAERVTSPSTTSPSTTTPPTTSPSTTSPSTTSPSTTSPSTTTPPTTTPPTTTAPSTTTTVPAATTTITPFSSTYSNVRSGVSAGAWLATGERIPVSSASEPSGSFRTFCEMSHLNYDDPVVYPGQRGAAHLHMYYGNTLADANSTYESLRSTGSSTCQGGPLNRTGYWMPAVHNAGGKVVAPEYLELYYKGNGTKSDIASILTNPNGLRMIAGYNAANPGAIRAEWSCAGGARTTTLPACGSGQELRVDLRFPMCWNGRDLDSADHRSHMAYGTGGGGWVTAQGGCPSSHPYHLPEFTLIAVFVADGNTQNWYASSDRMPGMAAQPNGSTFHADWFGAWENSVQETWTQKCIRELRSCVWGELGDGTRLRDRADYTGPRLLDPPPR